MDNGVVNGSIKLENGERRSQWRKSTWKMVNGVVNGVQ